MAAAMEFVGEVLFAARSFREGAGEIRAVANGELAGEDLHDRCAQHMEAEEAEVVSGTQARDDELLLSLGGGGFFKDGFDFVKPFPAGEAMAADCPVVRKLAFVGGLDGGNGAFLGTCGGEELRGAGLIGAAEVEVISHHEEEGISGGETCCAVDGMAIAERFWLFDKTHEMGVRAGGSGVGSLVARADHDGDFLNPSARDLFGEDGERGLRQAIPVHERLEREGALVFSSGGDDGFEDFHGGILIGSSVLATFQTGSGGFCVRFGLAEVRQGGGFPGDDFFNRLKGNPATGFIGEGDVGPVPGLDDDFAE